MKVGSDAEWEPGPPSTLLAPGGCWPVGAAGEQRGATGSTRGEYSPLQPPQHPIALCHPAVFATVGRGHSNPYWIGVGQGVGWQWSSSITVCVCVHVCAGVRVIARVCRLCEHDYVAECVGASCTRVAGVGVRLRGHRVCPSLHHPCALCQALRGQDPNTCRGDVSLPAAPLRQPGSGVPSPCPSQGPGWGCQGLEGQRRLSPILGVGAIQLTRPGPGSAQPIKLMAPHRPGAACRGGGAGGSRGPSAN